MILEKVGSGGETSFRSVSPAFLHLCLSIKFSVAAFCRYWPLFALNPPPANRRKLPRTAANCRDSRWAAVNWELAHLGVQTNADPPNQFQLAGVYAFLPIIISLTASSNFSERSERNLKKVVSLIFVLSFVACALRVRVFVTLDDWWEKRSSLSVFSILYLSKSSALTLNVCVLLISAPPLLLLLRGGAIWGEDSLFLSSRV